MPSLATEQVSHRVSRSVRLLAKSATSTPLLPAKATTALLTAQRSEVGIAPEMLVPFAEQVSAEATALPVHAAAASA